MTDLVDIAGAVEQKAEKKTSADVRSALRDYFPTNSHALLFEVGNATGWKTNRHADAVAMGLWPSRGLEVDGIEIKVSRADFLKEMKDPEKSSDIQRFCNRWWLATPAGLVKVDEVPSTWGLLELGAKGMRVKKTAPALNPEPLERSFVAAMLRRASDIDARELQLAIAKEVDIQRAALKAENAATLKNERWKFDEAVAKIKAIDDALDINLLGYDKPEKFIAAFRLAHQLLDVHFGLPAMADSAVEFARLLRLLVDSTKAGS